MLHKVRAEMNLKGEVRLVRPQDIEEAYRIEVEGESLSSSFAGSHTLHRLVL